jgi:AcrR family transcriptional regulator
VGYERISTQLIAERAQVSRGAQTHHFPTKNDLLVGAMQQLLRAWTKELQAFVQIMSASSGPETYIRHLWQTVFSQPRYIAVLELMLAARGDPTLRIALQAELADWTAVRDAVFHETVGAKLGEGGSTLFLQLNLCMLRGMAVHASFNQDNAVNDRLLEAWIAMAIREFKELRYNEGKPGALA